LPHGVRELRVRGTRRYIQPSANISSIVMGRDVIAARGHMIGRH